MAVKKNIPIQLSQKLLLNLSAHIGSEKKHWNPRTFKYLSGERNENFIINLNHTLILLQRAFLFLTKVTRLYGFTAFVNQEPFMKSYILKKLEGKKRLYFLPERWQPGLITNFKEVIRMYPAQTPESNFATIKQLPQALFLAQIAPNYWIINEARCVNIPVVALIETEYSPSLVTYPIPCNNRTPQLMELFVDLYETTVHVGKFERANDFDFMSLQSNT